MAGAVGINLRIQTGIDLSGYESALILVKYPDATEDSWTPDTVTESSGYLNYETVIGDLEQNGDYVFQSYVKFENGEIRYGEPARYHIYENQVTEIEED